jgi:hypothetical protein
MIFLEKKQKLRIEVRWLLTRARNDKKVGKIAGWQTCYAQTDRLVNSDNSTESPILKEKGGNRKIFFFFN